MRLRMRTYVEPATDEFSLPLGSHQGMPSATEAQIVRAATAGDRAAFTQIVERHRSELQVHAYRMLGSLEDAQDALQEAYLRAWTGRATYRGESTFRAWLYRIT